MSELLARMLNTWHCESTHAHARACTRAHAHTRSLLRCNPLTIADAQGSNPLVSSPHLRAPDALLATKGATAGVFVQQSVFTSSPPASAKPVLYSDVPGIFEWHSRLHEWHSSCRTDRVNIPLGF